MDVNKVVICYWVSSHFQTVAVNIKRLMLCITGLYQSFTSSVSLSPCLLFSTPITLCHKNFVPDPPRTTTVLKFSLPSRSLSQNPGLWVCGSIKISSLSHSLSQNLSSWDRSSFTGMSTSSSGRWRWSTPTAARRSTPVLSVCAR